MVSHLRVYFRGLLLIPSFRRISLSFRPPLPNGGGGDSWEPGCRVGRP